MLKGVRATLIACTYAVAISSCDRGRQAVVFVNKGPRQNIDSQTVIRRAATLRYRQLLQAELTNPDKHAAEIDLMCEESYLLDRLPNGEGAAAIREANNEADLTSADSVARRDLDSQLAGRGYTTSAGICDSVRAAYPKM
jgi:hypothetical protein